MKLFGRIASLSLLSLTCALTSVSVMADEWLRAIPDFELVDQHGDTHSLEQYQAYDLAVFYVQGVGCPIARISVPSYREVRDAFADQNIAFTMFNANIQDNLPRIAKETAEFGIDFPIIKDEGQHLAFVRQISPEDIRFRFFSAVREFPHGQMARMTQIDYDREMAILAVRTDEPDQPTMGVVRAVTDPDNETAEFAILIRSALKGRGLGGVLMDKIIRYCRERGTRRLVGQVMRENTAMVALARSRGFEVSRGGERDILEFALLLNAAADAIQQSESEKEIDR